MDQGEGQNTIAEFSSSSISPIPEYGTTFWD
jgi:hypothetical protein